VDRLKSNIVANVSHELRSPLSSIKAYTELLLLGAEGSDAELRRNWLSVTDRETDRLTTLINNLLDLSRLESGRVELTKAPLQLGEVVNDTVALLQVQAERRDINIELNVQPGLPPLLAEGGLIRSVVRNLVSNAIKFNHDGGQVRISISEDDGNLKLSVEDEGIGIPQDAIPLLFTKFYRVPSAAAEETHGTGLGLALAREAVVAHGGRIEVESTPGKGSRFTVIIPQTG
jgi:two-component system phosphate regulon sensor histidine kinase PhoR